MKINRIHPALVCLFFSFCFGLFLWFYSDLPPYGPTWDELSNNYWGYVVDIAHKWRSGRLGLWDMTLAGGTSLFTSGQYPILNPTNVLAFVLDDNHFFLYKLIEPYVVGFFFMSLLLVDIFQLPLMVALFGALLYLGLPLAVGTPMLVESSIFLWGCFLFPAMVYVYLKFIHRSRYLAVALVGALIALQFAGGGVIQVPQLVIWWGIFIVVHTLGRFNKGSVTVKEIGIQWLLLIVMAFGLWGVQLIPTVEFSLKESARLAGWYPIDNFPLLVGTPKVQSFATLLSKFFQREGFWPIEFGFGLASAVVALIVVFLKRKNLAGSPNRFFLVQLWLATAIYIITPTCAGALSSQCPVFKGLLGTLSKFTFLYGIHVLDFCIVMTICVVLGLTSKPVPPDLPPKENFFSHGADVLVLVLLLLTFAVACPFLKTHDEWIILMWGSFFTDCFYPSLLLMLVSLNVIFNVLYPQRHWWAKRILAFLLIAVGFCKAFGCYAFNDKGTRTSMQDYHLSSPEYRFYQQAQGRYYMPYDLPPMMVDDYNLLWGVHGICGFLPVPPYRISKFVSAYHHDDFNESTWRPEVWFSIRHPSGYFPLRFPVDFTTINHGDTLPWPGFIKSVDGDIDDIWTRQAKVPTWREADTVKVASFGQIVKAFDRPPGREVLIEEQDARKFNVKVGRGSTVVVLPQMYQRGWRVFIDGHQTLVFPADYLFAGFVMPAGKHQVQMGFIPPGLWLGLLASVLCSVLLGWLIKRDG